MTLPLSGDSSPEASLAALQQAATAHPESAQAWMELGWFYQRQRQWAAAQENFEKATRAEPKNASAWRFLGACLGRQGHLEQAVEKIRHALSLDDRDPGIWQDLTAAYERLGRPQDAAVAGEQVVLRRPGDARALYAWAFNVRNATDYDKALGILERALFIDPNHAECHTLRGVILLSLGRLPEGAREYEWRRRMKIDGMLLRNYGTPEWLGETEISGKRLLLYAEQGFGDALQYIRYAALLARRGAQVIADVPKELVRLVGTVEGVQETVASGSPVPAFDLYCSLMSVPLACGTTLATIPTEMSYLRLKPEWLATWGRKVTKGKPGLRVGLAWAGSAANPHDVNRSAELKTFLPILEMGRAAGVAFYSLQKGRSGAPLPGVEMTDLMNEVQDFADTAALISHLDLVISVDTSVVHVAGALGKPVWVLLPLVPGFSWLLHRSDSPWYPTMRLFRKVTKQDWSVPVGEVCGAFAEWLDRQGGGKNI